ncbi:hypothetical protein BO71DRAFT_428079 [Aspergillus ellipticus CBS 707.79]|uniref:Uncharacterized protein n=1 Tax=Aspergillus ellipticus CBS 707.79 TaxID=1448320 RepID=A0A319DQG7_9EURO|nr:hypothetical protein BO71DRAFT_428079 [Aspergillus ellipticus CBS 707.79]
MSAKQTYRSLLRELPRRTLSTPTPLQQRIRELYQRPTTGTTGKAGSAGAAEEEDGVAQRRSAEAAQFAKYAAAQRTYAELVERYNPGMTLEEAERIRLTARRVGWDLPVESEGGKN